MSDDATTELVVPGSEYDAADHGHGMGGILRVAEMFGVRLQRLAGASRCLAVSPSGWTCTRADGHQRRHHATFPSPHGQGDIVLAVWHQNDY